MNQKQNMPPEQTPAQSSAAEPSVSPFVKTFAIVGFVAIVVLAAWMSLVIIRVTPSALSGAVISITSIFTGGDNVELQLATRVVTTGVDYQIIVDGAPDDVSHAFSYECDKEVTFSAKENGASTTSPILCEESYMFTGNNLTIIASSTMEKYSDVLITVALQSATDEIISDTALLTIVAPQKDEAVVSNTPAPVTPKPTTISPTPTIKPAPVVTPSVSAPAPVTRVVAAPISDPNGVADLKVSILATGIANKVNGKETFVAISPISVKKRAAVRFVVENVGTKTSDEWSFAVSLPLQGNSNYTYSSDEQAKLRPGDRIEYTLSFDELVENETRATIDIALDVTDSKSSNNIASKQIQIKK